MADRRSSFRGVLASLLVALLLNPCGGFAQSLGTAHTESVLATSEERSPDVQRLADAIGVQPLLARLSGAGSSGALVLRQQILERVAAAGLELDGVLARIQYERELFQDIASGLQTSRDRALGIGNIAGIIVGGGMGAAAAAMQFSDRTAKAGDVIAVASGAAALALSLVAIRLQRGGKRAFGPTPNMLAPFFDRPSAPQSRYPTWIWDFMSGVLSDTAGGTSIREQLIQEWVESGRIDFSGSRQADEKIAVLTAGASQARVLTIDLVTDRRAMLSDVGARVALLKQDLARVVRATTEP